MGENLEHFHIPSYYAEAKYDDVIAYIPKKSECIWYWVKRNGNRNAAILSCYYSPNKGKGQAAENCNQFFHFNFHNNTASLSLNHANIPAVSIDVYRKMLQFLLDFGIDCTLRIISFSNTIILSDSHIFYNCSSNRSISARSARPSEKVVAPPAAVPSLRASV